jgi:tetratricopeptide (TPR) repeat protein
MNQEPRSDEARRDLALAHVRLGHINRMLERRDDAEREYRDAIARLTALATQNPENAGDRQALAIAFNWLGETLRLQAGRLEEAASAYDSALEIQQALVKEYPDNAVYQQEMARTLSNRGILRWADGNTAAEADFREALRVLEPISTTSPRALQEIGRVANNLAAVRDSVGSDEARDFYERAVAGHERLVQQNPANREYQLELATFCNNLAMFLHDRGVNAEAERRSRQALSLMTELARPSPSLAIERADAHTLRGMIVQAEDREAAERAYENALDLFGEMQMSPAALRMPTFHIRFGDLLINLAALARTQATGAASRRLLLRGLTLYSEIAERLATAGAVSESRVALETLTRVIPELDERDRSRLLAVQEQVRRVTDGRGPS